MNHNLKYGDLIDCSPVSLRTNRYPGKLTNVDRPNNCKFMIDHTNYMFGIVYNIWDYNTDTYHKEYHVLTGYGERNSKVAIGYRIILDDFTLTNEVYYSDPHDVHYWSDRIDDLINRIQKDMTTSEKIKSIKNKFNREEKLKRILDEK